MQDYILGEIPESIKSILDKETWLNSYNYCIGFDKNNLPTRIFFAHDEASPIYYRVEKSWGFIKTIVVVGFPKCSDDDLKQLLKHHKAQLVILDRIESAIEQNHNWQPPQSNIYLKSYMTIAPLADTKEAYFQQLGKNKRKQLPQYMRRFERECTDKVTFFHKKQAEIDLKDVITLELLNRKRRGSMGKSVDAAADTRRWLESIFPLIQQSGFMLGVRCEGKIWGGNLSFIHNDTAYMLITGHDSENDRLRIGHLCIWKTIEHLIGENIRFCNFLWGRKPYKTQFLGIEHPMSVHIVSKNEWLASIWKYKIAVDEFVLRVTRAIKTRLGFTE